MVHKPTFDWEGHHIVPSWWIFHRYNSMRCKSIFDSYLIKHWDNQRSFKGIKWDMTKGHDQL